MKFTSLLILVAIFNILSFEGVASIFDVNLKDSCCKENSTKNTCQNNHQEPCGSISNGICISNLTCHISGFVLTKLYTLDFPIITIKQKAFQNLSLKILSDYANVNWRPPKL